MSQGTLFITLSLHTHTYIVIYLHTFISAYINHYAASLFILFDHIIYFPLSPHIKKA